MHGRKWMNLKVILILTSCVFLSGSIKAGESTQKFLKYAASPVENPLKGLVPYSRSEAGLFPYTMEFSYIPMSKLIIDDNQYNWQPMEKLLDDIAGRGHQAVFRIFLEYPGKKDAIPAFLIEKGLKIHRYRTDDKSNETPDYNNPHLRKAIKELITALGKKYDGDPRIGFMTAGFLGAWGEWHNYPRSELFASKEVQAEVMDAFEAAFKVTPVLLRYPVGEGNDKYLSNAKRGFGYHDDSFAWATIDTGKEADDWFFMAKMKDAGDDAENKWKTQPIGGEIRPEAWGKVFDLNPDIGEIQDFRECVSVSHVSWLMDSGMLHADKRASAERTKRAMEEVRRMGYEFHVRGVTLGALVDGKLDVKVEVENLGVAPFYYDWQLEFGIIGKDGSVLKTIQGKGKIIGLLPGDKPRVWREMLAVQGIKAGNYQLALRIANPLPKGMPVRFANETQDQHQFGWLSLIQVEFGD